MTAGRWQDRKNVLRSAGKVFIITVSILSGTSDATYLSAYLTQIPAALAAHFSTNNIIRIRYIREKGG